MILTLERFSYAPTETEGRWYLPKRTLFTIERPWIPNPNGPGGMPFRSCIPEGEYTIEPWTRPNGERVFIIHNPALGVYKRSDEAKKGHGRYLIFVHAANWVSQVVGCIAPGTSRGILFNPDTGRTERAVMNSNSAMEEIRKTLGEEKHTLVITKHGGTI